MVTTPCPHCNQKIEFDATMPGTYECPYCGKQFKLGKRTKSNSIGNTTKPQKVVQQAKRSVGENIVLGLSLPIGIICMIMSIIILFNGLSRDRFILFFFVLPFSLGLYLLLYSYKIISEPGGSKRATSNQTATLLMGGEEITIQLESKNNKTSVDNALNIVAVGMSISLVLTIVGLIVVAIAIYIFVMQFFLFLGSFGGGGW